MSEVTLPAGAPAPRRGPGRARLGRYALFQLRDFVLERLVGVALVLALLGYISYLGATGGMTRAPAGGDAARDIGMRVFVTLLRESWILIALVAVNGIVSTDRTTGRYRFIFAKPVHPARFYVQAFVVYGIAALACTAVAGSVIMALTAWDPGRLAHALLIAGAGYLLVGGLCFLASTLWRLDWLATGGVLAAALLLRMRFRGAELLELLPPTWVVNEQLAGLLLPQPPGSWPLVRVAGYGLVFVAAGLLVLHRRPLAR